MSNLLAAFEFAESVCLGQHFLIVLLVPISLPYIGSLVHEKQFQLDVFFWITQQTYNNPSYTRTFTDLLHRGWQGLLMNGGYDTTLLSKKQRRVSLWLTWLAAFVLSLKRQCISRLRSSSIVSWLGSCMPKSSIKYQYNLIAINGTNIIKNNK